MTLFKQMAIAISTIIIILLSSVMIINYQTAKKDMIQSLYESTVNNISTLSSKLANANGDIALIRSIIDSEFDSGYYKMIEYKSSDNKITYKQIDNDPIENIPLWFIKFSDIKIKPVTADVSSSWIILGEVTVIGDTTTIYKGLYQIFLNLSYIFVISLIVTLIVLSTLLKLILNPLKKVQVQAEAILKNQFILQTNEPSTKELKDVVKAMNAMVQKVELIYNKANEALKKNQELLYNDPTTKLYNRRYLMLKLPDMLQEPNKIDGGSLIFLALDGAQIINQKLGRNNADKFLYKFGQHLQTLCSTYKDKVIARLNGTEFIMVLSNCEADEAINIAKDINIFFNQQIEQYNFNKKKVFINIGIYRYKLNVKIGDLLTKADNALLTAKSKENENIYLYEEQKDKNAWGKDQWRKILETAIQKDQLVLKFWTTANMKTHEIVHKVMTFIIEDHNKQQYYYGDFIAPAINLGLASKLYLKSLKKLFSENYIILYDSTCSLRIPSEFINDQNSYLELEALFKQYHTQIDFKLTFEVTDNLAIHNTELVKRYIDLFSKYGFGFGINSFTGESDDYNYLKVLNPEFIKSDCAFLLDQTSNSMGAIQSITDSLTIEIIATFVKTKDELDQLTKLNIYNVQGPITDIL